VRRIVITLLAALAAAPAEAQGSPGARLPREVFDVIPPAARVQGAPGRMRVLQTLCRPGRVDWARRRIVDIAVQEWAVFGFQTIDATQVRTRLLPDGVVADVANPPLARPQQDRPLMRIGRWEGDRRLAATIAGYWSATPDGGQVLARQNRQWRDGEGEINWVQPWSAAFVSWVMCEAGLDQPAAFARDISHRVYIDQAIRARDGQAPEAAYVAHDPGEVEIVPGDLLCNARGEARYATLADRRRELGRYAPTHCDIVVSVQDDRLAVIGGNVINGVSLTLLPLVREPERFPRPVGAQDLEGARTLFAHLQLQAPPIDGDALAMSPTLSALTAGAATPTSEPESSPDDAEEGDAP
jgi:hypothetical protein